MKLVANRLGLGGTALKGLCDFSPLFLFFQITAVVSKKKIFYHYNVIGEINCQSFNFEQKMQERELEKESRDIGADMPELDRQAGHV